MRIRATISAVLEYDIPLENYLHKEEVLDYEKKRLSEDPEYFHTVDWKVQVEEAKEDTL